MLRVLESQIADREQPSWGPLALLSHFLWIMDVLRIVSFTFSNSFFLAVLDLHCRTQAVSS